MKIIVLMGGPRAGVEFFQSLLDGHKQVLQFPGILYINEDLLSILSTKSKKNLAIKFIKKYSQFFNSKNTYIERHNILGVNKNKSYKLNKKLFIKRFLKFTKQKKNLEMIYFKICIIYIKPIIFTLKRKVKK